MIICLRHFLCNHNRLKDDTSIFLCSLYYCSIFHCLLFLFRYSDKKIEISNIFQGWAPPSFPFRTFRSFPLFYVKNGPFFPVLFLSFWRLMRPKRVERSLQKNAKIVPFFYKEQESTQERFVLLQKNARTFSSFSIHIYRYI